MRHGLRPARHGKVHLALLCLLAVANSLVRAQTLPPLHFFVEDALLRETPLSRWKEQLSRNAAAAQQILCSELKRVEKVPVCDLSLGAVSVTAFDEDTDEGLRTAASQEMASGAVGENGLNFLLDQESPAERRVFVVRRLSTCGGIGGDIGACTRVLGRVSIISVAKLFRTDNPAVTLLHELGHQAGLADRPDPRALMYRGAPTPRVDAAINVAEIARFRLFFWSP